MMRAESSEVLGSFDSLVERHYQPLFRFAVSLCGAPETAMDLTQQTFYVALRRQGQLREPSKFKSWLFSILFREFLQRRRHLKRFHHHSLEDCERELPNVAPDDVNRLDASAVREALQSLDEPFRAPLELFYVHDLSYKEIAARLGVPVGTVMSRLSRAKRMLRERLETNLRPKPKP
ncbi:MAG: RNA polymerase sigma factor [Verrucomicrobiota bacterium]